MKKFAFLTLMTLSMSASVMACVPESRTFACVVERHLVEFNNAQPKSVLVRTSESRPFALTSSVAFETHTGDKCTANVTMRRRSERVKLRNLVCRTVAR